MRTWEIAQVTARTLALLGLGFYAGIVFQAYWQAKELAGLGG